LKWGLAAIAVVLLSWQALEIEPRPGLDYSWQAALQLAAEHHLVFGREIVFTYGPLGFLDIPALWSSWPADLAFLYTVLLKLGGALAVFLGARRSFGAFWSFVIAVVVLSVTAETRIEPVIVLIVSFWALSTTLTPRARLAVAAGLGAFTAIQLLCKVSIGGECLIMSALTVLSLPGSRRKELAVGAGSCAFVFLLCWLATSQPLGAIPDYVSGVVQIVFGYGPAMSVYDTSTRWAYTPAFLMLGLGMWAALDLTTDGLRRQRIGAVLIWITFWFFSFKEAFVRQSFVQIWLFFALTLGGWFAFGFRRRRGFAAAVAVGLLLLSLAAANNSVTDPIHPVTSLRAAFHDLKIMVSPSARSRANERSRVAVKSADALDPISLQLLSGQTVGIFPTEIAAAWAYHLNLRPFPVIQSYSAYTPRLDNLDAAFLASRRAPERVLLSPPTDIDGRILAFDQPRTTRALVCRYRQAHSGPVFAVLTHEPDRCSEPHLLATETAAWGRPVPVPPPPTRRSLVFVEISGAGADALERIRSFLWKPALRFVLLNGASHRLVEATAADGLPLRSTGGLDYPRPFSLIPQSPAIAIARSGAPASPRAITYRFYWQSFTP
jgi:hypothetical protein